MMFLLVATLVPTLSLASLSFLSSFVPNSPNLHRSSYLVISSSISNLRSENNLNTIISESIEPTIEQLNTSINKTYSNQSFHDSIHTTTRPNVTDDRTLENTIAIVVPILFSLIFIIGLFGNALVVIVVTMNVTMRSTTNILILNLAIADLLFIVFCVPFTASDYYFTHWQFGNTWCKIVQYLILVLACASNYTLVLMSLDRALAVIHPISSMSIRTAKNAYIAICLIWLFITIACLPALQLHAIVEYGDNENGTVLSCTFNSTINITHTQFQLGFCVSSYVIPLFIAFALYFFMLKKLWFGSTAAISSSRLNNIRRKKRVTRMVIVVVLTFAICWAPIQIILVLKSLNIYHTDSPASIVAQVASQILAYTNSCINPILYAFLSENFRKAFHKIIACNLGGIYGVTQASVLMQTGQTSVAQSAYLSPIRANSAYKRNVLNKQITDDLDNNNNTKDQLPDIIESANKNLKSVNFSIVADGGLFGKNNSNKIEKDYEKEDDKIGETTSLIDKLDKQIKPTFNKGRFKNKQQCCLDNENELNENEFNDKMELHSTTNDQQQDFIPMYEFSVPSNEKDNELNNKESINDTINRNNNNLNNNQTTATTMTTIINNTKSNGVFL